MRQDKRRGYVWREINGQLYMQRCPECARENYALNVSAGVCTWCGYAAKESDCAQPSKATKEATK